MDDETGEVIEVVILTDDELAEVALAASQIKVPVIAGTGYGPDAAVSQGDSLWAILTPHENGVWDEILVRRNPDKRDALVKVLNNMDQIIDELVEYRSRDRQARGEEPGEPVVVEPVVVEPVEE